MNIDFDLGGDDGGGKTQFDDFFLADSKDHAKRAMCSSRAPLGVVVHHVLQKAAHIQSKEGLVCLAIK
ncbi:hypothetical protein P8C59_003876 [Phyllachora maydis]|uniref:Uncharacterized protein n=1 Tax=Phyllachora maydis TaxID=1825666 RepID=A0AAD9M9S7_9PEZI|nr:hypothetical protein P8C59_003876 [Phyllachora maydis]